jgi:hypothetical protein
MILVHWLLVEEAGHRGAAFPLFACMHSMLLLVLHNVSLCFIQCHSLQGFVQLTQFIAIHRSRVAFPRLKLVACFFNFCACT